MNKDNINTVAHRWILEKCLPDWIAVDATAGNGNDTLFLLQHTKKVYAFDIQEEAKENTLKRCQNYPQLEFHLIGHEHLAEIVHEPLDCVLFNFGYLPNSISLCITQPQTSLVAIQAAYTLLKPHGILVLACYLGHIGGKEEHAAIFHWITSQKNISLKSYTQKEGAPILYFIEKMD